MIVLDAPPPEAHPALRVGEAGWVWIDEASELTVNTRVLLSPNTTHALLGHGVVGELNALDLQMGPIGSGRDCLIPQAALDDASSILYEADRNTYGAIWEFAFANDPGPPPRELRVRIDNREYQRSLARLQDLVRGASRAGYAVRLRI
ncbi:MAG: hypothetical protein GY946_23425 [bacterium]|nr:hypothetical protein [bacterium]